MNKVVFQPLVDRVTQRIDDWSTKLLSTAGRLWLVKSILQASSLHWLQILPIPQEIADRVDRALRNFLWTGSYLKKPYCAVSWEAVCKPISF